MEKFSWNRKIVCIINI